MSIAFIVDPRLAPWATFCRRSAAGLEPQVQQRLLLAAGDLDAFDAVVPAALVEAALPLDDVPAAFGHADLALDGLPAAFADAHLARHALDAAGLDQGAFADRDPPAVLVAGDLAHLVPGGNP